MSSDKPIGPALPPMFSQESDEESDTEQGCKYKTNPLLDRPPPSIQTNQVTF